MLSIVLLRRWGSSSSSCYWRRKLTRNAKSTPTPELLNPYLHFNGFPNYFHVHSSLRNSGPENCSKSVTFFLNTTMTHVQGPHGINRSHCRDTLGISEAVTFTTTLSSPVTKPLFPQCHSLVLGKLYTENVTPK